MSDADEQFLSGFFRALDPQVPLDADDRRRVTLDAYLAESPIAALQTSIEWSAGESTHLFSGFRGTGKTTELRKLAAELRKRGTKVVLTDLREYLNLEDVIEFSHFLLALAGAIGDALRDDSLLGQDMAAEGYWTRFRNFLVRTNIEIHALESAIDVLGGTKLGVKSSLKTDPSFRQRLAEHLRNDASISALLADVRGFIGECCAALRRKHGSDVSIVFIFDSFEQIAIREDNHEAMVASLYAIFFTHANDLQFDGAHAIYTVPPWLKLVHKGIDGLYDGAFTLPCVKVRERDGREFDEGIELLCEVVARREDAWWRLFEDRADLRRLVLASGGYVRDLFRMLRSCLRRARAKLPIAPNIVDLAIEEIANGYLPIAHDDARWLARIADTHEAELREGEHARVLARFFDDHLVLCFLNGQDWYDVHPLVKAHVRLLAARETPP